MRTECLGKELEAAPSAVSSHFTHHSTAAGEEGVRACVVDSELRVEPQRKDSAKPGPRLFMFTGGSQGFNPFWRGASPWTQSWAKRVFDCACVLLALPVIIPVMLVIAAAVRLTSRGPALFLQERAGMDGRTFTIFKFRTMAHDFGKAHHPIATLNNQRFTPIGPFLRRWKLDELPQLVNVLLGQMSLVGPRPKMQEHVLFDLPCRPGITGVATIAFAQEADILARVPREHLDDFYRDVVLPAKREMDAEYAAHATLLSDLGLLIKTALRRWNASAAENYIAAAKFELANRNLHSRTLEPSSAKMRMPMPIPARPSHVTAVEQATAV